jgi:ferredoxin
MAKYKIEYDREKCIGAATCTVFYKKFKLVKDGKADLIGSKKEGDLFVLEVSEKDLKKVKEAAESCPVNAIHVYDGDKKLA